MDEPDYSTVIFCDEQFTILNCPMYRGQSSRVWLPIEPFRKKAGHGKGIRLCGSPDCRKVGQLSSEPLPYASDHNRRRIKHYPVFPERDSDGSRDPVHPQEWVSDFLCVQLRILFSSTSKARAPSLRSSSWNSRMSKRCPRALSALARSSLILSWPIL